MPFIHFSPYTPPRPRLLTDNFSQTRLTWLSTSFDEPSLFALVAGAKQSHLLINRDWILVWLFEIQTLLTYIATRVNGDKNEPFLQQADAEQLSSLTPNSADMRMPVIMPVCCELIALSHRPSVHWLSTDHPLPQPQLLLRTWTTTFPSPTQCRTCRV